MNGLKSSTSSPRGEGEAQSSSPKEHSLPGNSLDDPGRGLTARWDRCHQGQSRSATGLARSHRRGAFNVMKTHVVKHHHLPSPGVAYHVFGVLYSEDPIAGELDSKRPKRLSGCHEPNLLGSSHRNPFVIYPSVRLSPRNAFAWDTRQVPPRKEFLYLQVNRWLDRSTISSQGSRLPLESPDGRCRQRGCLG